MSRLLKKVEAANPGNRENTPKHHKKVLNDMNLSMVYPLGGETRLRKQKTNDQNKLHRS